MRFELSGSGSGKRGIEVRACATLTSVRLARALERGVCDTKAATAAAGAEALPRNRPGLASLGGVSGAIRRRRTFPVSRGATDDDAGAGRSGSEAIGRIGLREKRGKVMKAAEGGLSDSGQCERVYGAWRARGRAVSVRDASDQLAGRQHRLKSSVRQPERGVAGQPVQVDLLACKLCLQLGRPSLHYRRRPSFKVPLCVFKPRLATIPVVHRLAEHWSACQNLLLRLCKLCVREVHLGVRILELLHHLQQHPSNQRGESAG